MADSTASTSKRGELQLDFSNVIVPVAADTVVELSDGINAIAF